MRKELAGLGALVLALSIGFSTKPDVKPQQQVVQQQEKKDEFETARSLYYEKRFQEAIPVLENVAEDIGIFAAMLAHSYHMLGKTEKAVEWYGRTVALGTTGDDRGKYERSRNNDQFIPKVGPDPIAIIFEAKKEQDYRRAIQLLQDATKKFQDNPDLFEYIGHLYKDHQQFDLAVQFYDEAIFRQPEDPSTHIHKLYSLLRINRLPESKDGNLEIDRKLVQNIRKEGGRWQNILTECRYIIALNPSSMFHPDSKYSRLAEKIISLE